VTDGAARNTAVVVGTGPEDMTSVVQRSLVHFRELTEDEIAAYVATGEPFDKAGGYGIQGLAGIFVSRIEGSFTGIMGLPVAETATLLARLGVRVL
jgi:septum formation protein